MRNILTTLFRATLLVIVSFGTLSGLGAQEKPGGFGDLPVRNEIHRQYQLAPNTTVLISLIVRPIEIETISGQSAEINVVNSAETQADLNCLDTPDRTDSEKARDSQQVTLQYCEGESAGDNQAATQRNPGSRKHCGSCSDRFH